MGAGNEAVISVSKICELPRTLSRSVAINFFSREFLFASEIKIKIFLSRDFTLQRYKKEISMYVRSRKSTRNEHFFTCLFFHLIFK